MNKKTNDSDISSQNIIVGVCILLAVLAVGALHKSNNKPGTAANLTQAQSATKPLFTSAQDNFSIDFPNNENIAIQNGAADSSGDVTTQYLWNNGDSKSQSYMVFVKPNQSEDVKTQDDKIQNIVYWFYQFGDLFHAHVDSTSPTTIANQTAMTGNLTSADQGQMHLAIFYISTKRYTLWTYNNVSLEEFNHFVASFKSVAP